LFHGRWAGGKSYLRSKGAGAKKGVHQRTGARKGTGFRRGEGKKAHTLIYHTGAGIHGKVVGRGRLGGERSARVGHTKFPGSQSVAIRRRILKREGNDAHKDRSGKPVIFKKKADGKRTRRRTRTEQQPV